MPLTTAAKVKAWADPDLDAAFDTELGNAVNRASDWIVKNAKRVIEQDTFTEYFDGGRLDRCDTIVLRTDRTPVAHAGADLIVVKEDGVTLTAGVGYDESADFLVIDANDEILPCRLRRNGTEWSSGNGIQNIEVTYKAGYASGEIPLHIEQLANEVAWLFFRSPDWIGKSTQAAAGESVSWEKNLTPLSQQTLRRLFSVEL